MVKSIKKYEPDLVYFLHSEQSFYQAMYILSNANDANGDLFFSFMEDNETEMDAVQSGYVMDLDLTKNNVKIKKCLLDILWIS